MLAGALRLGIIPSAIEANAIAFAAMLFFKFDFPTGLYHVRLHGYCKTRKLVIDITPEEGSSEWAGAKREDGEWSVLKLNRRTTSSFTNYQLPITNYPLPITHYQLPITHDVRTKPTDLILLLVQHV